MLWCQGVPGVFRVNFEATSRFPEFTRLYQHFVVCHSLLLRVKGTMSWSMDPFSVIGVTPRENFIKRARRNLERITGDGRKSACGVTKTLTSRLAAGSNFCPVAQALWSRAKRIGRCHTASVWSIRDSELKPENLRRSRIGSEGKDSDEALCWPPEKRNAARWIGRDGRHRGKKVLAHS
ncbi:hypothetical protein BKA80DRAFT_62728 [Phyllosticta citrichinensis]